MSSFGNGLNVRRNPTEEEIKNRPQTILTYGKKGNAMNYSFQQYQSDTSKTAIYPKNYALMYTILGLCGEVGEIANKAKKIIRDDNEVVTIEKKLELKSEIGDVLWYLSEFCSSLDISLEEAALENIEKLSKRKERGTLHGKGDDR